MTRFIVFGSNGVLGKTIVSDLISSGHEVEQINRQSLDIFNEKDLSEFLKSRNESTIINCVAYMPADKCETDPELSKKINVDFVESLANKILITQHLRLMHFSSDFVFGGNQTAPYNNNSKPDPINIYGLHKYESEKIVMEMLPTRGHVIRFASLVSHSLERKTFLERVIDRAQNTGTASVVSDLTISVATSELITKAVVQCQTSKSPLVHAVHVGQTSWYEIATCAFKALGLEIPIKKVNSSEFVTAAKRPVYSALEPSKEIVEIDSRNWDVAVSDYVVRNLQAKESK